MNTDYTDRRTYITADAQFKHIYIIPEYDTSKLVINRILLMDAQLSHQIFHNIPILWWTETRTAPLFNCRSSNYYFDNTGGAILRSFVCYVIGSDG